MGIAGEAEQKLKSIAGQLLRRARAGAGEGDIAVAKEPDALRVVTPAFPNGGPIPARHAAEQNVSPALAWGKVPANTQEVVLLVEDPDAPTPQPFVHWALYGIPPTMHELPEGLGVGAKVPVPLSEGKNSRGGLGFFGPKPAPGGGMHRYHFQIFALDAPLGLGPAADRDAIVAAMKGHLVAHGDVIGTYERS